jgi:hypothetical protein
MLADAKDETGSTTHQFLEKKKKRGKIKEYKNY